MQRITRAGRAGWMFTIGLFALWAASVLPACGEDEGDEGQGAAGATTSHTGTGTTQGAGAGGSGGGGAEGGGGGQACPILSDACEACHQQNCSEDCLDAPCAQKWATAEECLCAAQNAGDSFSDCISAFTFNNTPDLLYCMQDDYCTDECGL